MIVTNEEARAQLDLLIKTRGWLGTPIFHRARKLFEDYVYQIGY